MTDEPELTRPRARQAIKLAVLGPQIGKIGLDPKPARNPPDHLVGRIFAAVPVQVLPQPSMQGGKLAVLDLTRDFGMRVKRGSVDLRAQDVTDGIALKRATDRA